MTWIKSLSVAFLVAGGADAFSRPPCIGVPSVGVRKNAIVAAVSGTDETDKAVVQEPLLAQEDSMIVVQEETSSLSASGDGSLTAGVPEWVGPFAWRGVVGVLCALWASNFAAAKLIMAEPGVDSTLYAVSRFSVAALSLAPFALNAARRSGVDWETVKAAAACGLWVSFGYLGQTLGLLTTTASRSCVICSIHCVFVAIVAEFIRVSNATTKTSFDIKRLIPAMIAVMGVAIVELKGAAGAPTIGDALSLAQPIGFGMGYLQLEEIMSRRPDAALPVSAIKLLVVALSSFGLFELLPLVDSGADFMLKLPDFSFLSSPVALGGILYTGLITTALALWIESVAFVKVPATDASIILTTEPIFAALFGGIALGETFGISDYAGASLILGACVLAALLDNPGDKKCIVGVDEDCEPPRQWPFWGF